MISEIRRLLATNPFTPFSLKLADERELKVAGPDWLWITPKEGISYWHQEDDSTERLNPFLIIGVKGSQVSKS